MTIDYNVLRSWCFDLSPGTCDLVTIIDRRYGAVAEFSVDALRLQHFV